MEQQIQIRAKDEDLKGNYSNLMQIMHTKEEFMLDFFMVTPPNGLLTSRVVMSPGHAKRMINALKDNLEKYEGKFGKIEAADIPETKIGFEAGK